MSFVRSVQMDSWTEDEIKAMQVGGNQSLRSFFEEHGVSPDATIREKYSSPAAALYREMYILLCLGDDFQHQSESPRRGASNGASCRLRCIECRNPARTTSLQVRRRRIGEPSRFPRFMKRRDSVRLPSNQRKRHRILRISILHYLKM